MPDDKFSYYQFQKELGYEVYLRFEDSEFENCFTEILDLIGFDKVERDEVQSKAFDQKHTKVLRVISATPRVTKQINQPDYMFDKYGAESISQMGVYDVYRYKDVGMMVHGSGNFLWELGIKSTRDKEALRTILTRYLSFALASKGVVGFWGVPVEEGFIVMNPMKSNYESVFIDLNKKVLMTCDGVKDLDSDFEILRLESGFYKEPRRMKREELLSFLSMNTSYLSYTGFEQHMKSTIHDLVELAVGYIYPESRYKPRQVADDS